MIALAFGCASASASGTSVQPTSGTEPGVTIDEGSPAAKEYALALSQARHTGSTGSHTSSSEAPFGAGIKPPGSPGAGGGSPARGRRKHSGGAAGAPARTEAGSPAPPLPSAVLRADRVSGSGGGSLLALLGGGVAILVLGGLGGVVLRHNRKPPSPA